MIKNERQYAYSRKKLKELEEGLEKIKSKYAEKPNKAKLLSQGYNEHLAQIREELFEYERIKSSAVPATLRAHTPEELGRRMIELRMLRELTQADLAKKVGCKQSDISRMERIGYKGFSLPSLIKIAGALDANLEISFIPLPFQEPNDIPLRQNISTSSITFTQPRPQRQPLFTSATDGNLYSGAYANA